MKCEFVQVGMQSVQIEDDRATDSSAETGVTQPPKPILSSLPQTFCNPLDTTFLLVLLLCLYIGTMHTAAMVLDASCYISYRSDSPIPAIMMLRPRSGYAQWITREEYAFEPHAPVVEYTDNFGNLCQRVVIPKGSFEVSCSCRAHTADVVDVEPEAGFVPVQELPETALQFLLPSRYCQSDLLSKLASSIVGQAPTGYRQVAAIEQWLRREMRYVRGSSNAKTSAMETADSRIGVCRDYAHLGIALSRSLNIPARMVVGYLYQLEPMDLHAWFEAFVGGRWFTFDGTQQGPRGNRITIGYGRDAADVALTSNYGALELNAMKVTVETAS